MFHRRRSSRVVIKPRARTSAYLDLEPLDARDVPARFGIPWVAPEHLTLSFAPDGTSIAGSSNVLSQTLNPVVGSDQWRIDIARALQTWAIHANVNIGVRPDGGLAFGEAGQSQGDSRFGDIRIGASVLSPEVAAVTALPDPLFAGTLGGDIVLNSQYPFAANYADLFAAMLHEGGHALGIAGSDDPLSPMFSKINSRTELTADDIAAIQALYGERSPDSYEKGSSNDTIAKATSLDINRENGRVPGIALGDITTLGDVDVFEVRPNSSYNGPITFRIRTEGLSLLAPQLTVRDEQGRILAQVASNQSLGDALSIRLDHAEPGARYYVMVEGATRDVFGIGGYGLAVSQDLLLTVSRQAVDDLLIGPYENIDADDLGEILLNPNGYYLNDDSEPDQSQDSLSKSAAASSSAATSIEATLTPSPSTNHQAKSSSPTQNTAAVQTKTKKFASQKAKKTKKRASPKPKPKPIKPKPAPVVMPPVSTPTPIATPTPIPTPTPAPTPSPPQPKGIQKLENGRVNVQGTHYQIVGSLTGIADSDTYQVVSPRSRDGEPLTMTIVTTGLDQGGATPRITVSDDHGAPITVQVVVNENGQYAVHLPRAEENEKYWVKVETSHSLDASLTRNYRLDIEFSRRSIALNTFASGELNATTPRRAAQLYVANAQIFRFLLQSSGGSVAMTIRDGKGAIVYSLEADAEPISGATPFLTPGEYTVTFASMTPEVSAVFQLLGNPITDPIGPSLINSNRQPVYQNPIDPSLYLYPNNIISTLPYYWLNVPAL